MIVKNISTQGRLGILDLGRGAPYPDFQRFNLIYGWNRSGKTTLSRVFEACELKSITFKQYSVGGIFKLTTDSGQKLSPSNIDSCDLAVKVFNKDFIDRNVSFDSSECNPIVYISEDDIASKVELEKLRGVTDSLVTAKDAATNERVAAENAGRKFLEGTALSIKNAVGNLQVQDQYRNYDKGKLKALLESVDGATLIELPESEFEAFKELISNEPKPEQAKVQHFSIIAFVDEKNITELDSIDAILREVSTREVDSKTLERLKTDLELNRWVRDGFRLQQERDESERCPYCEQRLDIGFMERLMQHFSDDYEALERDARRCLDAIKNLVPADLLADVDLYPEFVESYRKLAKSHTDLVTELKDWIKNWSTKLQARLDNPMTPLDALADPPVDYRERYDTLVDQLNIVIGEHNSRVSNHADEVSDKKRLLTNHIISEAMRTQKYDEMQVALRDTKARETAAVTTLDEHRKRVDELKRTASNIGAAIDKINGHLEGFFGGDEIILELDTQARGYLIKRDGRTADNLSEGEKTAIAFSYFVAKTQERNFLVRDGIIVIDDPISSFDSNYIYHCFALIRRHFKTAGQLFILTHNFELFNLTKSWFNRRNNRSRTDGESESLCSFYTIETELIDNERIAHIVSMDETLRDYNSEYQYLFARLIQFSGDSTPNYADLYTISNIARRFLEIYAGFKIPNRGDLRSKVKQLPTTKITDVQKEKVYRLVQEYSHANDPTCAVVHRDRCEALEAVRVLLAIVEESDSEHYRILKKGLPPSSVA